MARIKLSFEKYRRNEVYKKRIRILSAASFILGIFLGMMFYGMATWADFEASLFDTSIKSDDSLKSLRCPIVIGPSQEAVIAATIRNTLDRKNLISIRASFSDGYITLMRQDDQRLTLEPGEITKLEWPFTAKDAVWDRVVMARVTQARSYPEPSKSGSCGILLINFLGLNGNWTTAIWLGITFLLLISGLVIWSQINQPLKGRPADAFKAMLALSLVVSTGILIMFVGVWMLALLVLLINFLLVLSMAGYFILYS